MIKLEKRGIVSNDKKNRARYIDAKYKELMNHNFFRRLHDVFYSDTENKTEIEKLDNDWLRASMVAEKRCKARYNIPYTDEIANLCIEKSILEK